MEDLYVSLSELPLSYCTNVHPGRTLAEVEEGLSTYTAALRRAVGRPIAAGLWLARPVVTELLAAPAAIDRLTSALARGGLTCHTLNAFPFGDFHGERVKDNVYLPDWTTPARLDYTTDCATVLAALLPPGVDGSISTLPLGFKAHPHPADFMTLCAAKLIDAAVALADIQKRTGRTIRLAVEPEPLCTLETTDEAVAFFTDLWRHAAVRNLEAVVRDHIGLCYDVCHQAVEFEDIPASLRAIHAAGIRINKIHLSCALRLERPAENAEGCEALKRYVEPRYLHQTTARRAGGALLRHLDLSQSFIDAPPADFQAAPEWRIHFHVPVDAEKLGPLGTTRGALKEALAAVRDLPYAPHLEVETYTWEVLPGGARADLVTGLAREMNATWELIQS